MNTNHKPTLAATKAELRPLGVVINRKGLTGEYRVNVAGGTEATAYYTDDIQDAIGTGKAMAQSRLREQLNGI